MTEIDSSISRTIIYKYNDEEMIELPIDKAIEIEKFRERISELSIIYMNNIGLSKFPWFMEAPNEFFYLQTVSLAENSINIVGDMIAPNLKNLDLSHNIIRTFPQLEGCQNLTHLIMSYNHILAINKTTPFPKLTHLILDHNEIFEITDLDFPNLRELELNNNRLDKLINFIGMPYLRRLCASHNNISDVSDFICFDNLRELDISYNKLTQIPNFQYLFKLKHLILNHNKLIYIPNLIRIIKLVYIDIDDNLLTDLPILSCVSLKKISIRNNRIAYINNQPIIAIEIDLEGNPILYEKMK